MLVIYKSNLAAQYNCSKAEVIAAYAWSSYLHFRARHNMSQPKVQCGTQNHYYGTRIAHAKVLRLQLYFKELNHLKAQLWLLL